MKITPSPQFVHFIAGNLAQSLHLKRIGYQHVAAGMRRSPTQSVIFCGWHQDMFGILASLQQQRVAALASLSRDGTIVADYMTSMGLYSVRGSSSRGGLKAIREMIKKIGSEGYHGALTIDGPRGPARVCKPGVLEIARRSGAPIIPIASRSSREITMRRAWDQQRYPLPFARVAVCYGEPWFLPASYASPAEQAQRCQELAQRINALQASAANAIRNSQ